MAEAEINKVNPAEGYALCDAGAYPEPPLSGRIAFRITDPQRQPKTDEQRAKIEKAQALMERIRRSVEARTRGETGCEMGERENPP